MTSDATTLATTTPQSNRQTGMAAKTAFGLLLTLGLGSLPYPVWDHELDSVSNMVGNEVIYWGLVAATFLYVVFVEKRPLSSLAFKMPKLIDVPIAIGTSVVMLVGLAAIYFLVFPALNISEAQDMDRLKAAPEWWLIISVIRAGVSEEVLFRAYPISRLFELTGSRIIATFLPLAMFALAHVGPWAWGHLLVAGFGGAVLTVLYLWRRNLWTNILAHCLVDFVAVLS